MTGAAGRFVNYAGFYLGWLACVKSAALGVPWVGVLAAAALLAAHLSLHGDPVREARALAVIGVFGLAVESALGAAGLYRFASGWEAAPWLAPAWIVALWLLLGATFESSLAWCASRPWLAALLGLVGGPLSFAAGEAMGAARLLAPRPEGLVLVGAVWAAAFPAACARARAGRGAR
jgi:hypothetical protein